jgi:hypothetical protein
MMRATLALCVLTLAVGGCGPLRMPMAPRFEEKDQKGIDESWNTALDPVDRLDRDRWLDLFVGAQAYQTGVDKLSLRSEKKFHGGLVVMEITFDRAAPNDDRFRVQVIDRGGKLLRQETYTREEVERAYNELFLHHLPPKNDNAPDAPDVARQRAAHEKRWQQITEFFPRAPDEPR